MEFPEGYCLACGEPHNGETTLDGITACDMGCGNPATYVEDAGGQCWHMCEPCGESQDIAELTAALRAAIAAGADLPAPNPDSVIQQQVRAIAYEFFDRLKGATFDMAKVRRTVRSCFDTELRRIGLIGHGKRVKKGSDLDQLLDELADWALSASFASPELAERTH